MMILPPLSTAASLLNHAMIMTVPSSMVEWKTSHPAGVGMRCNLVNTEKNYHPSHTELAKKVEEYRLTEKQAYQRNEWFGHLLRFRNDAFFIPSIICLQLPFELAYANHYEIARSDIIKFGLTAVYLLIIQYLTKIGDKVSVKLIKCEYNRNSESKADSLIYKVFGLYFMQTYIGLFYHAILHRNFLTLRKILTQRMIASQVLQSFVENCIPYLKYSFKKHRTVNKNNKGKLNGKVQLTSRVEKEHLKPSYSASIGEELEDGLFDDFLELALQFGIIMMLACAFPLAFCLAALNNAAEIRTDALNIFQVCGNLDYDIVK
ncbi:hypothetical protein Sjap_008657 [Stephania japonica]|uniref:Anoctamin transmembrane domain-containing protein n=1 Tax=Stephania japonica TaxID=461633 RepID=A0AAP0JRJ2_9MAGN